MNEIIIKAIAKSLYDAFGDQYAIYTQPVKQGLKKPCFSIVEVAPTYTNKLGTRKRVNLPVAIHYFGNNGSKIINDIVYATNIVTFGNDSFLAKDVSATFDEYNEVTNINVTYAYDIVAVNEHEPMEDLTVKGGLNNEKQRSGL